MEKNKGHKKARKRALELAALSAATAIAPEAAQIVVQPSQTQEQGPQAARVEVPEPKREEYTPTRQLRNITDLVRGVFGIGRAHAEYERGMQGGGARLPLKETKSYVEVPGRGLVEVTKSVQNRNGTVSLFDTNNRLIGFKDAGGRIIAASEASGGWAVRNRDGSVIYFNHYGEPVYYTVPNEKVLRPVTQSRNEQISDGQYVAGFGFVKKNENGTEFLMGPDMIPKAWKDTQGKIHGIASAPLIGDPLIGEEVYFEIRNKDGSAVFVDKQGSVRLWSERVLGGFDKVIYSIQGNLVLGFLSEEGFYSVRYDGRSMMQPGTRGGVSIAGVGTVKHNSNGTAFLLDRRGYLAAFQDRSGKTVSLTHALMDKNWDYFYGFRNAEGTLTFVDLRGNVVMRTDKQGNLYDIKGNRIAPAEWVKQALYSVEEHKKSSGDPAGLQQIAQIIQSVGTVGAVDTGSGIPPVSGIQVPADVAQQAAQLITQGKFDQAAKLLAEHGLLPGQIEEVMNRAREVLKTPEQQAIASAIPDQPLATADLFRQPTKEEAQLMAGVGAALNRGFKIGDVTSVEQKTIARGLAEEAKQVAMSTGNFEVSGKIRDAQVSSALERLQQTAKDWENTGTKKGQEEAARIRGLIGQLQRGYNEAKQAPAEAIPAESESGQPASSDDSQIQSSPDSTTPPEQTTSEIVPDESLDSSSGTTASADTDSTEVAQGGVLGETTTPESTSEVSAEGSGSETGKEGINGEQTVETGDSEMSAGSEAERTAESNDTPSAV